MDLLISFERYQGSCQVSSASAQLIVAHSNRNWSRNWIISALLGLVNAHTLSHAGHCRMYSICTIGGTHLLKENSWSVSVAPPLSHVLWLQINAYRPVALGAMIANYVLLSFYSETEWKAVGWVITVSILFVHYYHIISLGGEILIFSCHCVEVIPTIRRTICSAGMCANMLRGVGWILKKEPPSPDCIVSFTSF